MTNYSLQQEMDKVASQLAGVEAQFQTALDRLVETHTEATSSQVGNIDVTNLISNKDGTAEHNPQDPNYYNDSMAPHTAINETGCDNTSSGQQLFQNCANKVENQDVCLTQLFTDKVDNKSEGHEKMMIVTTENQEEHLQQISANTAISQEDTKILSKGKHNQTLNTEESWQTKICANTANIKEIHTPLQHYRRTPPSTVTIIRITAGKPELSIRPMTQAISKVTLTKIECGGDEDRLAAHGDMGQGDKELSSGSHYKAIYNCENLGQASCVGLSIADDTNDVTTSGCHIKSEVKSVDENEPETTNVLKCIISHDINNPMKTCPTKFIRRTKSVVVNHKDRVDVFQLKQHCRSLEGELDGVKSEIVRILSEKDGFLRENGMLKDLSNENESLKEENMRMRVQIKELIKENGYLGSPNSSQDNILLQLLDRSSPDGQEIETILQDQSAQENFKLTATKNIRMDETGKDEQIRLCEESLEMMKLEFEEMERYWINKLNSERKFYEEHLHQSEIKFNELELQIQSFVNFIENEEIQAKDNETQDTEETIGKLPTIKE